MESKNDLSCEVVRDLLPMYCEQLVSKDSKEAVDRHFKHCAACKDLYEKMGEEFEVEKAEPDTKEIEPLKKVKRRNIIRIVVASLLCIAVCAVVFSFLFVGVVPLESEELTVTYTAEKYEVEGKTEYSIDFLLSLPEGKILRVKNATAYDEKIENVRYIERPYQVCKLPFDDLGEYPNQFGSGVVQDEPFDDNDIFTIEYRDKKVSYNLKEIAEECGIQ